MKIDVDVTKKFGDVNATSREAFLKKTSWLPP